MMKKIFGLGLLLCISGAVIMFGAQEHNLNKQNSEVVETAEASEIRELNEVSLKRIKKFAEMKKQKFTIDVAANFEEVMPVTFKKDGVNVTFSEWYDEENGVLNVSYYFTPDKEKFVSSNVVLDVVSLYSDIEWKDYKEGKHLESFDNGEISMVVEEGYTGVNLGVKIKSSGINTDEVDVNYACYD